MIPLPNSSREVVCWREEELYSKREEKEVINPKRLNASCQQCRYLNAAESGGFSAVREGPVQSSCHYNLLIGNNWDSVSNHKALNQPAQLPSRSICCHLQWQQFNPFCIQPAPSTHQPTGDAHSTPSILHLQWARVQRQHKGKQEEDEALEAEATLGCSGGS